MPEVRILSLDPGITTGYALVDLNGNLLESGNILAEDIEESILTKYVADGNVEVVQELLPIPTTSKMDSELVEVVSRLRQWFPDALLVKPAMWKQIPMVFNYPFPSTKFPDSTPHQRDAYRMAIYYLTFNRMNVK